MILFTILLIGSVVLVIYAIMLYNGLVALKHAVSKAWANIDVLLKQRHDELPKLVETCKQYMQFEQTTLEKVIQARSQVSSAREAQDIERLGSAESGLRSAVGQLFAVAESYPDLKSNETFVNLQGRITSLENAIADRRELYNESVNLYNIRIEQFPDSLLAKRFAFQAATLLAFDSTQTADVDMKNLFQS